MKICYNTHCVCNVNGCTGSDNFDLEIGNCMAEDLEVEDCKLSDLDTRPAEELGAPAEQSGEAPRQHVKG